MAGCVSPQMHTRPMEAFTVLADDRLTAFLELHASIHRQVELEQAWTRTILVRRTPTAPLISQAVVKMVLPMACAWAEETDRRNRFRNRELSADA